MPEECITVSGGHLESLEKPEAWLPLAPYSCELFAAYQSTELPSLSAVKSPPLRETVLII